MECPREAGAPDDPGLYWLAGGGTMAEEDRSAAEVGRRGELIYEQNNRPLVEPLEMISWR